LSWLERYQRWLHTGWPAGVVEALPLVKAEGRTNVPGVYIVGDLTGIPLLKFSSDTGARVVHSILAEEGFQKARSNKAQGVLDIAIIGAGIAGVSSALEAKSAGLDFSIYEASRCFSTIKNFPKGKPIYTYPTDMDPAGQLTLNQDVKEGLVEELDAQLESAGIEPVFERIDWIERTGGLLRLHRGDDAEDAPTEALRVVIAIGRTGNFRALNVPGEELEKVSNRLHDPKEFSGQEVLVAGGGDSACEAAIALTLAGAHTTLSYRKDEFTRPKPDNLAKLRVLEHSPQAEVGVIEPVSERVTTALSPQILGSKRATGSLQILMASQIERIEEESVTIKGPDGRSKQVENDAVFAMIGREPPLDFFRRSGVHIAGEWSKSMWAGLVVFFAFCVFIYHWKSYYWFPFTPQDVNAFAPFNPSHWIAALTLHLGASAQDKTTLLYTVLKSASGPSFYYTLLYSCTIAFFGWRRIQRRQTPYVTLQTTSLIFFQWLPLFILPELVLPWMGRNGFFSDGALLRPMADLFFEAYDGGIGQERAYWRAYGFVLAWPLMVYNWFTHQPIWGWLVLGFLQTFVLIPLMIRRWGKGAFCGWICSCGALAETLGDTHRHKMPHGPKWNRLNMLGQGILALAFFLMFLRVVGWIFPQSWPGQNFALLLDAKSPFTYKWLVDNALAGFLGVGLYFHYSGRMWCRFACPLAALMHIYARFSSFRIFSDKKKCISCNVCTSVCHQGIDVMNFANKGLPMQDPQCVRCSACVQSCPTGVLAFGRLDKNQKPIHDRLPASLVQITERPSANPSS
jgi:NosR/NirI family transcriptional regulator, nitrous oxide reductase regulator